MGRLTERNKDGDISLIGETEDITIIEAIDLVNNALDKLAHYEDLEEAGKLIVVDALTDALGDRHLFFIGTNNKVYGLEAKVIAHFLNQNTKYELREEVYFTQVGAERKLKELEGGKE